MNVALTHYDPSSQLPSKVPLCGGSWSLWVNCCMKTWNPPNKWELQHTTHSRPKCHRGYLDRTDRIDNFAMGGTKTKTVLVYALRRRSIQKVPLDKISFAAETQDVKKVHCPWRGLKKTDDRTAHLMRRRLRANSMWWLV